MISAPNRLKAVELIEEAVNAGATKTKACSELDLSLRTYQRWTHNEGGKVDGEKGQVYTSDRTELPKRLRI